MKSIENKKHKLELAHIMQQFGQQYHKQYKSCFEQQKAMRAIIACRTSAMGGHTARCNHCGFKKKAYNSCRNKHCPKCQFIKQEQWVDKLKGRLLPIRHFFPKALRQVSEQLTALFNRYLIIIAYHVGAA